MQPPRRTLAFLRWFCREEYVEEIEGDLTEMFCKEHMHSARKASRNFTWRVLKYFRPGYIKSFNPSIQSTGMFKNYFVIAWRNLRHNKSFSSLNIIGLSIGMACCLIIFQYVTLESGFDHFHEKRDNLYRVLQAYARAGEQVETGHAYTAQALAPALKNEVPEITNITRVHSENALVSPAQSPEQVFEEDRALYIDAAFMKMFTFPMVTGSATLSPGTVLVSETAAKKYFGNAPAEGRVLEVTGNTDKSYTVIGVFQDIPANSHLQFSMLLPIEDLLRDASYSTEPEGGWSWNNFTTYLELHPGADRAAVKKKMTDVFLKHRGEIIKHQGFATAAIGLQPLNDIHLNAEISGAGSIVSGSYKTLYFFLVIGLITLAIALVNYINLATARALNRSREVGVRKAIGAKRNQLVGQFLYESAFTNVSAMLIALVLTFILLPFVNDIAETQLSIQQWLDPMFLGALAGTLMAGTLLAGLYPAFVLSSFRPAAVLKGKGSPMSGHFWLRKGLVIVQFTACVALIAGTIVVFNQLTYMRTLDLGLNLEHVVSIRAPRVLPENANRASLTAAFVQEIKQLGGVERAALSSTLPGQGFNWNGASIRKVTDDPSVALQGVATYIDSAFAPLYGLERVAGREFSQVAAREDTAGAIWKIMLNETAAKNLGYKPEQAVNEIVMVGEYQARVIGVYKDFKWSSAHQPQENIVFGRTSSGRHISVRLSTHELSSVMERIEEAYRKIFPGNLFQYSFVDETFDLQYKNDKRFARLFSIFAGMSIFIACLGLFGLVAFTAQQRTKEIGMRKVLGASVAGIVALLGKDFLILVLIGFALAVPVTLYTMSRWLENFAYRTDIGFGIFALAGLMAVIIALATVSWQSFRAAIANPVKSLRNE